MARMFWLQLLGFGLLLSTPSAARVSEAWLDQVIKVCDREFVRTVINICGTSVAKRSLMQQEFPLGSGPSAENVPSYISKDAEPLIMMLKRSPNLSQAPKAMGSERQPSLQDLQQDEPAFKNSVLSFEKFENVIPDGHSEAETNSLPELKYLGLETHSRKKRQYNLSLSNQCCIFGCTRRSIAKFC